MVVAGMPVLILPEPRRADDLRSRGSTGVSEQRSRAGAAVSLRRPNGGLPNLSAVWRVHRCTNGKRPGQVRRPECAVVEAAGDQLAVTSADGLRSRSGRGSALAPRGALDAGRG